jgi:DNA (cytosine-5)-methyltransferase 1
MKFTFADLFCGAGGATSGVVLAAERNGLVISDGVAINHWTTAVETHSNNHPHIRHLCQAIERVDPCEAVPSGRIELLWASPECVHFSRARGGRPRQNQSRAGASHILTWLDKLYVKNLIIENVPEFEGWGPLDAQGQPIKSKIGENFRAFIESLKARNYNVDYRVLNAADFGDATTRKRLFVIARRKPLKIVWPEPSHRKPEDVDSLFGKSKSWKAAKEIIDWTDLGTALSQRKKPLRPNTIRRIAAGLEKFCGLSFIVQTDNTKANGAQIRSVDDPIPTVVKSCSQHLATPLLVTIDRELTNRSLARTVESPVPTVTGGQRIALANFVVGVGGPSGSAKPVSIDNPLPTNLKQNHRALISPFILGQHSCSAPRDTKQPIPTIAADGAIAVVSPFLVSTKHGKDTKRSRSVDKTLPTLTAKGEHALCQPFLVKLRGTSDAQINGSADSVENPLGVVSTSGAHHAVCNPFLASYYGTGGAQSIADPLDTVTTRDRFLLVNPKTNEQHELEIYFRLLKPQELARAHSFPDSYKFAGNKTAIVKQIGNSNPVELTAALTACVL